MNVIFLILFVIFVLVEAVGFTIAAINGSKSVKLQEQMLKNNDDLKRLQKNYDRVLEVILCFNENKELKKQLKSE